MKKVWICFYALMFSNCAAYGQDSTVGYKLYYRAEIPLIIVGAAGTFYNFAKNSDKTGSSLTDVETLKKSDVNWFDRWGIRPYSKTNDDISYVPFYAAVPLPFVVFTLDKKMRKDAGKLSVLYIESLTITGLLYTTATHATNRLRPFVYSGQSPTDKRLSSNSKKSFFAGHVALVATSAFFIAQVISDYYPDTHKKWLFYGIAGAATLTTAYFRQAAGEHFLSDILVGATVGTLSGLLTPALHKVKIVNTQRLSITPYRGNSSGLTAIYRI